MRHENNKTTCSSSAIVLHFIREPKHSSLPPCMLSALEIFLGYALYKYTFYLLTYLLLFHYR